jgi:Four helix bundle sensory module for signal transduction
MSMKGESESQAYRRWYGSLPGQLVAKRAVEFFKPVHTLTSGMTSIQLMAVVTVLGLGVAFGAAVQADPASDACAALANARSALYSMTITKDKPAQDALKARMQTESAKLDSELAGMTGADAKAAAEFKAVWDQFKATRDNEIIPAIDKGNFNEAKEIADGIQLDRLSKMWSIMSCK